MISPSTPPGNLVVCVDDEQHQRYRASPCSWQFAPPPSGFRKGGLYTVHRVFKTAEMASGHAVFLAEFGEDCGFALERFRPATFLETIIHACEGVLFMTWGVSVVDNREKESA